MFPVTQRMASFAAFIVAKWIKNNHLALEFWPRNVRFKTKIAISLCHCNMHVYSAKIPVSGPYPNGLILARTQLRKIFWFSPFPACSIAGLTLCTWQVVLLPVITSGSGPPIAFSSVVSFLSMPMVAKVAESLTNTWVQAPIPCKSTRYFTRKIRLRYQRFKRKKA